MRKSSTFVVLSGSLLLAALAVLLVPGTAAAAAKHTQRVSVSSGGSNAWAIRAPNRR